MHHQNCINTMDHYVTIENPGCTPVLQHESIRRYSSLPPLFCFDCPLGQGAGLGVGRRMVWLLPAVLVWKAERIGERGEKWPITSTKKRGSPLAFLLPLLLGWTESLLLCAEAEWKVEEHSEFLWDQVSPCVDISAASISASSPYTPDKRLKPGL